MSPHSNRISGAAGNQILIVVLQTVIMPEQHYEPA